MTAKIKLNAASGGGSVSLEAPTSTTGNANVEFKLPVADGTSGQALTTNASGQLAFATVSSAIQTTSGTDNFTIADGNLVIGTSGHGIDFGATSNASNTGATMSNELLSDYEEGSWTITMQVDSYNFNGTYSQQSGRYIKIGSMVHCVGYLQLTNKGNDNGTVSINGLPFTTSSGGNGTRGSGVVGYYQGTQSVDHPMVILVEQNDTKITMRHSQSSGSGSLGASDIENSFGMFFQVTYIAA